ncbi:outer membrane lipid asymmetry maintenance protein MlaD [Ruixingdingia sedimenti]|uniref:Outer membrane lipid asymmetry maintenance protein MlaD n=1 Tax=Ruixingdingia sedimenti TaxID=3073604 RepID=A0ABU1FB89_9RHOB|nr:outer membrane lipid asymmetry maintenance protein MlaD [Xinfangfangia sp. LG-4]MDR5653709.1 outer membrane lipid asymmetry maintenance protein MlaD [Xinfangfangia sp. LG-4]
MAENTTEVIVGGAVLAVAIGFLIYAGQSVGLVRESGSYELRASFRSVEGVTVGTDVRLAGVKVGTVTALALNPQSYFADATLAIRAGVELPDDSTALISSEGLLGGNFVELQPGGSPFNLEPGGEIEDTQGSVSLIALLMKFVGSGAEDALKAEE